MAVHSHQPDQAEVPLERPTYGKTHPWVFGEMPTRRSLKSRPDFLDQADFHCQLSGKGPEVEVGWGDRRKFSLTKESHNQGGHTSWVASIPQQRQGYKVSLLPSIQDTWPSEHP